MLKVVRTLDAYLLSSVNVNLTKSFCILSTNELLKRRQGNNNNKRLKSKPKSEGKQNEPNRTEVSEEASEKNPQSRNCLWPELEIAQVTN